MWVHQIWIGTKPPPQLWMDSVVDFCKIYGHKYKLWDNDEVQTLNLRSYSGIYELYEYYLNSDKKDKWPAMADILRYIILYERGGIFIDADSVVVNGPRFDEFLRQYKTGIVCGAEKLDKTMVANGVIICNQYNFIMKKVIEELPDFVALHKDKEVWEQTGPVYMTHMFNKYGKVYGDQLQIVPKHYFYPIDWHGIEKADAHQGMIFHPDTMLFQYGYSTNNFAAKLEQGKLPEKSSTYMYTILLALGALYLMNLLNARQSSSLQ